MTDQRHDGGERPERPAKDSSLDVYIDYTNHKGERAIRRIRPVSIRHDTSEYHATPQWILRAYDMDRDVWRNFAMRDIHSWNKGVKHQGLDTAAQVFFYEQEFYVLSNFSSFNLRYNRHTYPTSEHAYQASKFLGYRDDIHFTIRTADSAHDAYKWAQIEQANRRPDWDDAKVEVMRDILRSKAAQHPYVTQKLLETGNRELVENSWRDDFWGWGSDRNGKNMLGKLWMEVRTELAQQAKGAKP